MNNSKREDFFYIYKNIYKLPELTYKEEADFDFFKQCREDYNFVVLAIYNERKEFLLLRDLNKNIGWELVGGYIEKEENIIDAVNRIIAKEVGLLVDEVEPVAILTNIFKYRNSAILHRGIAFMALSRGRIKNQPSNIKTIFTKEIPGKLVYQNKKVLEMARRIIENKVWEPPFQEIESGKKFYFRHIIHKLFVNNIGRLASKKIRNKISQIIFNNPRSIIDICCGDDDFIFFLEKKYNPDICLANDISWKTLSFLRGKEKKSRVLFINHNVLNFPLKERFDLVIFKNALHHIPKTRQENLIRNLIGMSKQLIIVDVNNPAQSSFVSKLWHWYYIYFLGDQGENFSTLDELRNKIEELTGTENKKINSGIIRTIKGDYFYISFNNILQGEEVELKIKLKNQEVDDIKKKLIKLGAVLLAKKQESDIYFTAPHRDFIKTKECLRIRETEEYLELTYKGLTTPEMLEKRQFWKPEVNITINKDNKEKIISLFKLLNFKKVVEVNKEREVYILDSYTVNIDNIRGAGYFLEIEQIARDEKERNKALETNVGLLNKLGLSEQDIIDKPYRDIMLEKNNNEKAHSL